MKLIIWFLTIVGATYAPTAVECPNHPLLRYGQTTSDDERLYITNRQTLTDVSLQKFLNRVKIPGFDVKRFTLSTSKPLNLAIAISGGGYRASLTALGFLTALDDRSSRSMDEGHLGGLLQSASYISSISGGTWTLMSLSLSDFIPLVRLRNEWDINEPLLEGVPSLKMMDVSRNEIQVLPPEIRAVDDSEFYDKLNNNRNKRDFGTTGDESFDDFTHIWSSCQILMKVHTWWREMN
ncbi:K13333 lysophospholipase [Cyberlindnera jadinii]|uniref:Lysophospholipase n=1 Tax=Cyberlindnera jadinii (strain ATCC 18201 / CBS 1600 / BCRC 20928 / JCM 3617 / NBRC 0987 / NRRL Y-1542) TaxID=983966 RepID=A0A0H5C7V5_CYBJN|nr:K13333 lysophospholipase [Cyberlindnera jadinii]